jgi:GTPase SAR1 family protein
MKILIVGPKKCGKSGIANYLADPANFGSKATNKTYLPTVRFQKLYDFFYFFIFLTSTSLFW